MTEPIEGWYTDPYGRHEARWMSDGKPTKLIRDGGFESYDEPPDEPPSRVPEPIVNDKGNATGLRRADDAEREGFDPKKVTRAAWDAWDRMPRR